MAMTSKPTPIETSHAASPKSPGTLSNLKQRLLTSLVLGPLIFIALLSGGILWGLLGLLFMLIGLEEFYSLSRGQDDRASIPIGLVGGILMLAGFYLRLPVLAMASLVWSLFAPLILALAQRHPPKIALRRTFMTAAGVAYVAAPLGMLIALRSGPNGIAWVFAMFCLSAGTDTFAYFGGRLLGRHKLAPTVSPSKTVEGALIGAICGLLLSIIALHFSGILNTFSFLMMLPAPLIAIVGDLFESALKRHYHVKDSHLARLNLLPGHGGVLDRIDSALFIAVYGYVWLVLGGLMFMT